MSRPRPNHNYSFDDADDAELPSGFRHEQAQPDHDSSPQRYQQFPAPTYSYEPPPPPVHRRPVPSQTGSVRNPFDDPRLDEQAELRQPDYSRSLMTTSTTTPGRDNMGPATAGGGIAGIAIGVANTNERESGLQAAREVDGGFVPPGHHHQMHERNDPMGSDTPYIPAPPSRPWGPQPASSNSSMAPIAAAGAAAGLSGGRSPAASGQDLPLNDYPSGPHDRPNSFYADSPYKRYSSPWDPRVDQNNFHPDDIEDDGDDGFATQRSTGRRSIMGLGRQPSTNVPKATAAGATGGMLGGLGAVVGSRNSNGNYGPVSAADGSPGVANDNEGGPGNGFEKSQWLAEEAAARKRKKWIFIVIGVIAAIGIIVGATIGGVIASRKPSNTNSGGQSAAQDDGNGDLDANSAEIKKLLNNPDLHRVFPGIDYTPYNAQYPECLSNPPSQNNITRDMAVLSQLSNTIRLYGTDCNQTDMVLHSIKQLGLKDMKVWPAIWLDNNATTNARGLNDMHAILERVGADPFAGVVIGNEVLYRKDLSMQQLTDIVSQFKANLTKLNVNLPIAIADLGDNWKPEMVQEVDVIMSNVHPYFAGVAVDQAPGWTWNFWQQHDVYLTAGNTTKKHVVSEVGWPSGGGNNCGQAPTCSTGQGSVAGIDEMNKFMEDYVCQSLKNGTDFFW